MGAIGILTAGGDCPGLNAVIRGAVSRAEEQDVEIVGIRDGWEGLMHDRTMPLDRTSVRGILGRGGTILGTSRMDPYVHGDGLHYGLHLAPPAFRRCIMKTLSGFFCGLLFGIGLVISGMSDPAKVLNFLDLFGTWDPSLAFVMGGAVVVTFIGYRIVLGRPAPVNSKVFHLPTKTDLDGQLMTGAALFGVGWGLGGFCPGPAFTALPLASNGILAFFPALIVGMWLGRMTPRWTAVPA